jgi:hypothetical protein
MAVANSKVRIIVRSWINEELTGDKETSQRPPANLDCNQPRIRKIPGQARFRPAVGNASRVIYLLHRRLIS